jgi:hypothetical protein
VVNDDVKMITLALALTRALTLCEDAAAARVDGR